MRAAALAELVRWPAALSVPGDVLLGAAAAGRPVGPRTAGLVGASTCLYWAGMALNDWADRDVDALERPHRPIPSGRVRASAALALAGGLTAAGLGLTSVAGGRRGLAVAVPLAATVWAYDLGRSSRAGSYAPVAMVAARALDVLLGAGGSPAALPAAGTVAAHTAVVMGLSAVEASGGPSAARRARVALAGTAAVTALAAAVPVGGRLPAPRLGPSSLGSAASGVTGGLGVRSGPAWRSAAAVVRREPLRVGLLGAYAGTIGVAQLAAARDPRPATVQRAVGAGVLGLIPLEAALLARSGRPAAAAGVAALWPVARRLSRRVSTT